VPGFGARITSAGALSFVLNYRRKADGLERRYTIGTFPSWSVTAAREEAKRLKREVDGGGDPVGKFQAEREAPTVAGLCARFETEHLPRLRPDPQPRAGHLQRTNRHAHQLGNLFAAFASLDEIPNLLNSFGCKLDSTAGVWKLPAALDSQRSGQDMLAHCCRPYVSYTASQHEERNIAGRCRKN
jgi:Arm domain-containing DNA-binding protein